MPDKPKSFRHEESPLSQDDLVRLQAVLVNIKNRMLWLLDLKGDQPWWVVEAAFLNMRQVLESIMMLSFTAHRPYVDELSKTLLKKEASGIRGFLQARNSDYWPTPATYREDGASAELVVQDGDYLRENEWGGLHGKVSDVLHSRNPYREALNMPALLQDLPLAIAKTVHLTNSFVITMADHGAVVFCDISYKKRDQVPRAMVGLQTDRFQHLLDDSLPAVRVTRVETVDE